MQAGQGRAGQGKQGRAGEVRRAAPEKPLALIRSGDDAPKDLR